MLKEVSKEKPAQAPRHPSTEEAFKKLLKENPVLQNVDKIQDTDFLKMLHDFKVDSFDPQMKDPRLSPPEVASKHANRKTVPGKLSSEKILELFAHRYTDAAVWTPENIAETYKINQKVAADLVQYYSSFNVFKPGKVPGPLDKIDLI